MTPHILLIAQSGSLLCQHCCQLDPPPRDMPVERWIDHCKGFLLMHKHCEKALEPSKQVALFDDLAARESATCFGCSHQPCQCDNAGARAFGKEHAGIDGMTDEPAPEIDPPGPADPVTSLSGPLLGELDLRYLVTCIRPKAYWPTLAEVEGWHQDVRTRVQDWCRIEHAHAHPIAGMTLPARFPMPNVLENIEFDRGSKPAKKKRGARPLSSGKRRSGSTQHTP